MLDTLGNSADLRWWEVAVSIFRFGGETLLTLLAYIQTIYIVMLFWWKQSGSKESFGFDGAKVEVIDAESVVLEEVDIIIPCCKEPLQMIKDTVSAVIAMDWPTINIFVCDDGVDDEGWIS